MPTATTSGTPHWHALLSAATRAAFADDIGDSAAVLRRATLLRDVKQRSDDPVAWSRLLQLLTERRDAVLKGLPADDPRRTIIYDTLLELFRDVVGLIPPTPSNRYSEEYLDLWLGLAALEEEFCVDRARETFKLIKIRRVGRYRPAFYEAWARFEARHGNCEKASKLRGDAVRNCPAQKRKSPAPVREDVIRRVTPPKASTAIAAGQEHVKPNIKPSNNLASESIRKCMAPAPVGDTRVSPLKKVPRSLKPRRAVDTGRRRQEVGNTSTEKRLPLADIQERVVSDLQQQLPSGCQRTAEKVQDKENESPLVAERKLRPENMSRVTTSDGHESQVGVTRTRTVEKASLHREGFNASKVEVNDVEKKPSSLSTKNTRNVSPVAPINRLARQRRNVPVAVAGQRFSPPPQSRLDFALSHHNRVFVNNQTYQMLKQVGKGGSSQVFRVISEELDVLALKRVTVNPDNRVALTSYANEIELLEKLRGESTIVQLHDAQVLEKTGEIYVVMELGDVDLAKLLKGQPLDHNVLRTYWRQMLAAVRTIHQHQIIHGDLKPANFISVAGCLKLIDFGIAKAIDYDDDGSTKIVRDCIMGTPNYMAPEALSNIGEHEDRRGYRVGRASDIWSLGCILYQMVYGRTPFSHIRNTVLKTQNIKDPAYEIAFKECGDKALEDVLRGCLQRSPDKRYSIPELMAHPFLTGTTSQPTMTAVSASGIGTRTARDVADSVIMSLRKEQYVVRDKAGGVVSERKLHGMVERCEVEGRGRRMKTAIGKTGSGTFGGTPSVSAITKASASSGLAV